MSVFVTEANLGSSVNVMRSLGRRGIKIISGDVSRLAGGFWSKYCNFKVIYPDPNKEQKFIQAIISSKKKYKFNVLLGMSDITIKPFVRYNDKLEKEGIHIPIPDEKIFFKLCDKYESYKVAKKVGIKCPMTYLPDKNNILSLAKDLGYPVVIKPINLTGGRGITYAKSKKDVLSSYKYLTKKYGLSVMFQEYIPGKRNVYTVSSIFNRKNKPITSIVLKKLRESPISGGTATFAETVSMPNLQILTNRLLRKVKWVGVASPEFKIDPRDEKPKLMEINTRLFGYLKLAIESGIDLPFILYKIALDEKIKTSPNYRKLYFSRFAHDILVFSKNIFLNTNIKKHDFICEFINDYKNRPIVFDYLSTDDFSPFFFSIIYMINKELNFRKKKYEVIKKRW